MVVGLPLFPKMLLFFYKTKGKAKIQTYILINLECPTLSKKIMTKIPISWIEKS